MDELDRAQQHEETARKIALKNALSKTSESPEFDEHGERICIDCGVHIPHPRIDAVNAIRCVICQQIKERGGT